ncbi:MAG: putative motility protein [Lentisphaeraceae bacterium]|nr:putative motility protein [Lentisphaeraceae bacterium]
MDALSGPSEMQAAAFSQSKDVAVLKKSIDNDKQMAAQLIDAIPKVNHDAPKGQQVRMTA